MPEFESHIRGGEEAITAEIERLMKQREAQHDIGKKLHDLLEGGVDHAKQIAPVRTGAFRDSIRVEDHPNVDEMPAMRIVSDVEYANLIEYGTVHTPPRAVFGQTQIYLERLAKDEDFHIYRGPGSGAPSSAVIGRDARSQPEAAWERA
ncbi:MAG: HK97 gp10 family phage protein, partial [Mycobacterium sp.]